MYRTNGRLRRYTLGAIPCSALLDARQKAAAALRDAFSGSDPASAKLEARRQRHSEDLAKEYVENHAKFKNRGDEDRRVLYRSPHKNRTGKRPHTPLVKRWGAMKVRDMTRRDVRELLDDVAARGPIMANRTLAEQDEHQRSVAARSRLRAANSITA